MIDKINVNSIHFDGQTPGPAPRPAQKQGPDATLQIDFEHLIEQAGKLPQADTDAVNRARQLLESGRLDSQASIKEAAEEIAENGV